MGIAGARSNESSLAPDPPLLDTAPIRTRSINEWANSARRQPTAMSKSARRSRMRSRRATVKQVYGENHPLTAHFHSPVAPRKTGARLRNASPHAPCEAGTARQDGSASGSARSGYRPITPKRRSRQCNTRREDKPCLGCSRFNSHTLTFWKSADKS